MELKIKKLTLRSLFESLVDVDNGAHYLEQILRVLHNEYCVAVPKPEIEDLELELDSRKV